MSNISIPKKSYDSTKVKKFLVELQNKNTLPWKTKTKPSFKQLSINFDSQDAEIINYFFELIKIDRVNHPKSKKFERALRMLLANLVLDIERTYWLTISRNEKKFFKQEPWFKPQYVIYILDVLINHQLVEQDLGNNLKEEKTKIIPTVQFQNLIKDLKIKKMNISSENQLNENDLVVLENRSKLSKEEKISLKTQRDLVKGLNESLKDIEVRYFLDMNSLIKNNSDESNNPTNFSHKHRVLRNLSESVEENLVSVSLKNMVYKQVFGDNLEEHGRLYGSHQNLPKHIRHNLQFFDSIKNEYVNSVELDYSSTHLKMIYDLNKIESPMNTNDYYSVPSYPDIPRKFWKEVAMRAINCDSFLKASRSLSKSFNFKELPKHHLITLENLDNLLGAFLTYHKSIEPFLFKGNLKLMNLDSKIALRVMTRFMDLDKPILAVHDSFVVQVEDTDLLFETMIDAWCDILDTTNRPKIKIIQENVE